VTHGKFYLQSVAYGKRITILNTENIKISGRITKLEATKKMQFVYILFHICRKFEFLISQGQGSVAAFLM